MRSGRKRKSGKTIAAPERYRGSANLKLESQDERRLAMWNRIKHDAAKHAADPKLTTKWGELYFLGHLSETEVEAADRYATMLAQYDKLNGYRRTPKEMALEKTDKATDAHFDDPSVPAFLKRFDATQGALLRCGGVVEGAVTALCRNEYVARLFLSKIKSGLSELAKFYGLDRVKRAA